MHLENVEELERYRPGGYHPISIGDCLHNRYQIMNKLGFGAYSTIWLARDEKAQRYVAIKVKIAAEDSQEENILHLLGATDPTAGRLAAIPQILDKFNLVGPNGTHQCLVTTPGGQNLSSFGLFQPRVARAISAQLVQAVAYLHSRSVVHGDLHSGNIMLHLHKSLDHLSPEQFRKKYGKAYLEPVRRHDGKPLGKGVPLYGVLPMWLGKKSEYISLPEARIFLTDFGEVFLPSVTPRYYSHTPLHLRPPETFFSPQTPLSFAADIWTLACTIWTITGQRTLFEDYFMSTDSMIGEYVDVLGQLPSGWWHGWDARARWFNDEGERDPESPNHIVNTFSERFEYSIQEPRREKRMKEFEEAEETEFLSMLQAMMAFRPEDRPSAKEVMQFEWMREWALPELDKMDYFISNDNWTSR
ncbi:kinase domain protein [Xylona heveae TC161]|uniref:non-specific serine/threonine protein kinase n=1 Tax=Xylona heveae (strain CBS 132557 / TC161) TaxID=1328760 RepID=A0A164ZIQ0_XYLHT|nr:kinase domain protein [Xylona heveae TC161]KZF19149.1 kinase domain protein [Xylona heveae TC161]